MDGRGRWLVVANAAAGGDVPGTVTELENLVGRRVSLDMIATTGRRGTARIVARVLRAAGFHGAGFDVVVAVGGDGTACEAAEGIARASGCWPAGRGAGAGASVLVPPVMLAVPAGTGNSVHRALWRERPWTEVVGGAIALSGASGPGAVQVRRIDLGRVVEEDRATLLGAGTGLLAEIVEIGAGLRELRGRARYEAAAVRALGAHTPYPGRVLVDGALLYDGPVTLAAVGGARHRAGTYQFLPRSVLDDGLLDVCVVASLGAERFVALAALLPAGRHLAEPEVAYGQGRRVVLEATGGEPLPFEHDGETWGSTAQRHGSTAQRRTIEVVPGAVPVFAPIEPVAG